MSYYQARLRWGRGWFIIEGPSPYIRLLFRRPKELHEFAWFMLQQESKTWFRSWAPWWVLRIPSRPWDVRFEDPPMPHEELAAWALTAVALWRALR